MVFSLFKAFHGQQILKNRELYFTVIKKLKEAEILELFLFFFIFHQDRSIIRNAKQNQNCYSYQHGRGLCLPTEAFRQNLSPQ